MGLFERFKKNSEEAVPGQMPHPVHKTDSSDDSAEKEELLASFLSKIVPRETEFSVATFENA